MKFCTHMAYIFVGSYAKFEVDDSVRYRDIAINVKWGKKIPPAARALIVFEIYGSYLSIMGCYYLGIVNFKYDENLT